MKEWLYFQKSLNSFHHLPHCPVESRYMCRLADLTKGLHHIYQKKTGLFLGGVLFERIKAGWEGGEGPLQ